VGLHAYHCSGGTAGLGPRLAGAALLSNVTDLNMLIKLFHLPENSRLHRPKSAGKLQSAEDPRDSSHLTCSL